MVELNGGDSPLFLFICAFFIFPDTFLLPDTETLCSQLLAIFPPNFVAVPCVASTTRTTQLT